MTNIQGDLAVSANKEGVRVEPMAYFRARRKKDKAGSRREPASKTSKKKDE